MTAVTVRKQGPQLGSLARPTAQRPQTHPTGGEAVVRVLREHGVRHVFGNPGTTEIPLLAALTEQSDIEYVLALHEAVAVAMADGYAQLTRAPAVVNLHTTTGLGNAIGALTNAAAAGTPLIVTAGQQDYRHIAYEPLLAGDLVAMARPVVKWAHEVRTRDELGIMLQRAFRTALTPPTGPVFLSLPMQILLEEGPPPPPMSRVDHRSTGEVVELAGLLLEHPPSRLAIVCGEEVAAADAAAEAVELADALQVPVWGATWTTANPFPTVHPLWRGHLEWSADGMRAGLGGATRILALGGRVFSAYPYTSGSPLAEGVELLHLSADAESLGRSLPVRLGVSGDLKATLRALVDLIPVPSGRADAIPASRANAAPASSVESPRSAVSPVPPDPEDGTLTARRAVDIMAASVPPEALIVDEAISSLIQLREAVRLSGAGRYFTMPNLGLGWGMPAAVGMSLATGRAVLCVVGDGAAMYAPQALWSAANLRLPVVFAVANNRQYKILKQYWRNNVPTGSDAMIGLDIADPAIDFIALAASMGVAGCRVDRPDELAERLADAFAARRPHLVDIRLAD